MIKLTDLLNEIEQERREQQLEEGWKENIVAAAMAASTLFGGIKGQTPGMGNIGGGKAGIEMTSTKEQPGPLNVNFGSTFPSGRYLIKGSSQDTLIAKLEEIGKYIAKNPSADYKIEIISSESQVPNYDAEKPGRVKLDTGELAEKRATVLNAAVKEFTDNLKQQGVLQGNVTIKIAPVLVGNEKFTPGVDNKDDAKYTKDQFVKLVITAIPKEVDKYAGYARSGERIFMDKKAYAMVFYPTAATTSKSSAGILDTRYQDVILKKIDRVGLERSGRSINPDINAKNQYTATYKIPWDQWNKATSGTNTITQNMMDRWEQFKVAD